MFVSFGLFEKIQFFLRIIWTTAHANLLDLTRLYLTPYSSLQVSESLYVKTLIEQMHAVVHPLIM